MLTLIYVIFTIVCVFLIITVLLQPGKAGGLGAAFGGGGNTVFGASGGTPVFRRMTTGAAILFMLLSLLLAYLSLDKSVTADEAKQKRGLDFGDYSQEAGKDELAIPVPSVLQEPAALQNIAIPEAPVQAAPAAPEQAAPAAPEQAAPAAPEQAAPAAPVQAAPAAPEQAAPAAPEQAAPAEVPAAQ